ncbi:peptidoglycan recognition protein family protein [Dysosmobacter sp.]|uniref:peptidoglycan recognition protein family protein n=1 Tax=Dysosmobacter sp. TaxID=2591382 RepID=UPI002AA05013|nr:peptidoglycan recognition family protein [Dysosmobacter sp.]MDY5612622.1 peptidoglycan recognition family protein [Dysosmobacter sp.]
MSTSYRRKRRRRRAGYGPVVPVLGLVLVCLTAAVLWVLLRDRGPEAEDVPVPDYVEQDYLTVNAWSRPGTELEKINGVVIHYVGNPGTTAHANRNYFESLSSGQEGTYASSHFIVGLEGEVIQCIPLTEIAYASNTRNEDTVSIEVCHPDETGEYSSVTYDRTVELTAWLCVQFRLDPETDVIRHYDVTGKECPRYYVEHPEAWDAFRADVAEAVARLKEAQKE